MDLGGLVAQVTITPELLRAATGYAKDAALPQVLAQVGLTCSARRDPVEAGNSNGRVNAASDAIPRRRHADPKMKARGLHAFKLDAIDGNCEHVAPILCLDIRFHPSAVVSAVMPVGVAPVDAVARTRPQPHVPQERFKRAFPLGTHLNAASAPVRIVLATDVAAPAFDRQPGFVLNRPIPALPAVPVLRSLGDALGEERSVGPHLRGPFANKAPTRSGGAVAKTLASNDACTPAFAEATPSCPRAFVLRVALLHGQSTKFEPSDVVESGHYVDEEPAIRVAIV